MVDRKYLENGIFTELSPHEEREDLHDEDLRCPNETELISICDQLEKEDKTFFERIYALEQVIPCIAIIAIRSVDKVFQYLFRHWRTGLRPLIRETIFYCTHEQPLDTSHRGIRKKFIQQQIKDVLEPILWANETYPGLGNLSSPSGNTFMKIGPEIISDIVAQIVVNKIPPTDTYRREHIAQEIFEKWETSIWSGKVEKI